MASSLLKPSLVHADPSLPARCARSQTGPHAFALPATLPRRQPNFHVRNLAVRASDGGDYSFSSDSAPQGDILGANAPVSKVTLPPRMCSLREFGEGTVAVGSDAKVSHFFERLTENVEFSYKFQDWEILSGRLAMMVFVTSVLVEAVTGNSVFEKMDAQRLLEISVLVVASIFIAAGFAVALQAKTSVAYTVSKRYESMMNGLIDSVFDNLLFDREDS